MTEDELALLQEQKKNWMENQPKAKIPGFK
jgi:hypothetical protein